MAGAICGQSRASDHVGCAPVTGVPISGRSGLLGLDYTSVRLSSPRKATAQATGMDFISPVDNTNTLLAKTAHR